MGLGEKLKAKICSRKLEPGDVVRVIKGGQDIPETDNTVGGVGRWAVYVGATSNKAVVRALQEDGTTGDKVAVEQVEHIDDVIEEAAVKSYKQQRLERRYGKKPA